MLEELAEIVAVLISVRGLLHNLRNSCKINGMLMSARVGAGSGLTYLNEMEHQVTTTHEGIKEQVTTAREEMKKQITTALKPSERTDVSVIELLRNTQKLLRASATEYESWLVGYTQRLDYSVARAMEVAAWLPPYYVRRAVGDVRHILFALGKLRGEVTAISASKGQLTVCIDALDASIQLLHKLSCVSQDLKVQCRRDYGGPGLFLVVQQVLVGVLEARKTTAAAHEAGVSEQVCKVGSSNSAVVTS